MCAVLVASVQVHKDMALHCLVDCDAYMPRERLALRRYWVLAVVVAAAAAACAFFGRNPDRCGSRNACGPW